MSKDIIKLPSVLGLQRSFVVTDAVFENVFEDGRTSPVFVVEHGVLGTQNINSEKGLKAEVANPQRTETAKMDVEAKKLRVSFDLRFASIFNSIVICSESTKKAGENTAVKDTKKMFENFINEAIEKKAIEKITSRMARNILNGRWLFRNRNIATSIEITVIKKLKDQETVICDKIDAKQISIKDFDNLINEEILISQILADGLKDIDYSSLKVIADVEFGVEGSFEVFCSQNYTEKEKGFARSLYKLPLGTSVVKGFYEQDNSIKVKGVAAFRDQKISNALKTIDTWYSGYEETGVIAAIEPLGANLELGTFLRTTKEDNGFEIMKNMSLVDPLSNKGLFLIALLVRGGVYGEGNK